MSRFISAAVGAQWIADFEQCKCELFLLRSAAALQTASALIVESSGLKVMGQVFHQFHPSGATGLFLLAESHLAIHTWPEFASVAIDLYVCNVAEDNSAKAASVFDNLVKLFAPHRLTHQLIQRGGALQD